MDQDPDNGTKAGKTFILPTGIWASLIKITVTCVLQHAFNMLKMNVGDDDKRTVDCVRKPNESGSAWWHARPRLTAKFVTRVLQPPCLNGGSNAF